MREDRLAPESMTLRQLGEYIQGPCARLPIWNLQAAQDTAPGGVTEYSDGSLIGGQHPWLALGAWGVHWPGEQNHDLPEVLRGSAVQTQYGQGTNWSGQNAGPGLSSARAEAMGLLATLVAPRAIHVGIDNASVVRRAQTLLAMRRSGQKRHVKPWGLQDDGDVWQAVESVVLSKGAHAAEVSKVKRTCKGV